MKKTFIDLFSGAGGMSCGLEMAGWACLLGIDHDRAAIDTFQHNHPQAKAIAGDIREISDQQIQEIIVGINQLMGKEEDDDSNNIVEEVEKIHTEVGRPRIKQSLWSTIRDPKTHRVTAVHVSNGGNNIAVYIPLFASSSLTSLGVILTMCYMTIGFWCFCSYNLTRFPGISILVARYGRKIAPFVLIYLGISIIVKSQSYRLVLPV